MRYPKLRTAKFIKRPNRFTAIVQIETGDLVKAYVPTTGRLTGVLRPGCKVWLESAENPSRKTPYSLVLAELDNGGLCSTNAALANYLFGEAVHAGILTPFKYPVLKREASFGNSRLDFRLLDEGKVCWVEIKSVTYAQDGVGKFPDAPTARGRRHLVELAKLTAQGDRASVVFVSQREDVNSFAPYEEIDPEFTSTLRSVNKSGVEIYAYRCKVSTYSIKIEDVIPVNL